MENKKKKGIIPQIIYSDASKKSKLNPPKLSNDETVWHHHEDGKTMQEVDKNIHERFRHRGGVSSSKKNIAFGKNSTFVLKKQQTILIKIYYESIGI